MNLSVLATEGRTPACWENQHVFTAAALDYDPTDDAYEHLDLLGHTILAAAKTAAEEAAVDVCFGCPLMLACEKMDEEYSANTHNQFVVGVLGGRTESERRARRAGKKTLTKVVSVPNPQIAPGDRGPRNQVDDELVARMTSQGKTSDQIARELNCSPRTVSRARKRMNLSATKPRRTAHLTPATSTTDTAATPGGAPTVGNQNQAQAVTALTAGAATAQTVSQTVKATKTAARHNKRTRARDTQSTDTCPTNPFIGGRPVSPAMEAIYNHLVTVGGRDHIDTLLAVGIPHVDPADALDWWTNHNSITIDGRKVLRTTKANTPTEQRITEGARAKVFNSVSATQRKGRYLDRDGDIYIFKAPALAAWTERMNALATT